jgi:hypothetical protein
MIDKITAELAFGGNFLSVLANDSPCGQSGAVLQFSCFPRFPGCHDEFVA